MTQIEQIKAEIERLKTEFKNCENPVYYGKQCAYNEILSFIESLEKEQTNSCPSKETILRVAKLHKVWSITAPWENIEDFVKTNWGAQNIV